MVVVFYKLNAATEGGRKPNALSWKLCTWINTLKAAKMAHRC
jgi:hypothetical protein